MHAHDRASVRIYSAAVAASCLGREKQHLQPPTLLGRCRIGPEDSGRAVFAAAQRSAGGAGAGAGPERGGSAGVA